MPKKPILIRLRERIEQRRAAGKSLRDIAVYARQAIGQFRIAVEKLDLTPLEMDTLRLMNAQSEWRRAVKQKLSMKFGTDHPHSEPEVKRVSLKEALGPTAACKVLNCTLTELNRWARDGRLSPDGEKFFYGAGPNGGSRWGRAWLKKTIDAAVIHIDIWRQQDRTKRAFQRTGLRSVKVTLRPGVRLAKPGKGRK